MRLTLAAAMPTRYDRCPKVFLSAIAFAATVIYRLCIPTIIVGTQRGAVVSEQITLVANYNID